LHILSRKTRGPRDLVALEPIEIGEGLASIYISICLHISIYLFEIGSSAPRKKAREKERESGREREREREQEIKNEDARVEVVQLSSARKREREREREKEKERETRKEDARVKVVTADSIDGH